MDAYLGTPQVTVIHKENGGKHTAVNRGIEEAKDCEFIGCLDADSFVAPDALREIIACFDSPRVAAATPAMSVFEAKSFLERMQNAEYIFGIALRQALSAVNGIYVTPGPFSFYRRSVLDEVGGFRHAHQAEDMEMALRMQRAGYEIENAPRARVFTKVPRTVPKLIKQRTRWTTGFLRNVTLEYRDLVGNAKYGVLGLLVLPLGFVAIISGVALFGLAVWGLAYQLVRTVTITAGVPLTFAFMPHVSFSSVLSSLLAPVTFLTLISFVTGAIAISFIVVGNRISNTGAGLLIGILGYALVYGLIGPFWLVRSMYDTITGTRRAWR
jgi:cellulose synthase/poly-beta-1,6-N-acetylglucosamine synthase-like glycosyltransferase